MDVLALTTQLLFFKFSCSLKQGENYDTDNVQRDQEH